VTLRYRTPVFDEVFSKAVDIHRVGCATGFWLGSLAPEQEATILDIVGLSGWLVYFAHHSRDIPAEDANLKCSLDGGGWMVLTGCIRAVEAHWTVVFTTGINNMGVWGIIVRDWDTAAHKYWTWSHIGIQMYPFRSSFVQAIENLSTTITSTHCWSSSIVCVRYSSKRLDFNPTEFSFKKTSSEIKQLSNAFEGVIKGYFTPGTDISGSIEPSGPSRPYISIIVPDNVRDEEVLEILIDNEAVDRESPWFKWL